MYTSCKIILVWNKSDRILDFFHTINKHYIEGDDLMNINVDYIVSFLEIIANTPSPSGNTRRVMDIVDGEFKKLNIETSKTNKGALKILQGSKH